jgi:hypothetical protein
VAEPVYAVIAGVNKAGTTSLFVSLSTHPEIAASAVKETGYFLPPRYGRALEPFSVWEHYFVAAPDRPVRLEATPSYFYGGAAVAESIAACLGDPHVILVLREPVARAVSFFAAQKARLRIPATMSMAEYLGTADRLTDDDFDDPENERFMACRGGRYADYLPAWLEALGPRRVSVITFEELVEQPAAMLRLLAARVGLDPDAFPEHTLGSENRTTGYRIAAFQRLALWGNDRLERVLRRHPSAKRRIRAWYFRVNGRPLPGDVTEEVVSQLTARFVEPNARLAEQLRRAGYPLPAWLSGRPQTPAST